MTGTKPARRTETPPSASAREKGYYWMRDPSGWTPHGFWDGTSWTFPWSAATYTDEEVGEIGPICRPPDEGGSAN